MSLYKRHRPDSWDGVFGNENTKNALKKMISKGDKCPRVFLFHGLSGGGKTTLARIFVNEIGCKGNDIREINSADFNGIATVRELREQTQYRPLEGKYRAFIIDECHQQSGQAQDAMLKLLEDTPSHVFFILCTTDPQKLKTAVKNRCQQFSVDPLSEPDMKVLLKGICKKEKEKLDKKVLNQIIEDGQGSARQAIQILEQVLSVDPEKRLEVARHTAETISQSIELCRALLSNKTGWSTIAKILSGLKNQDPEGIRRQVLGYAQAVLLGKDVPRAGLILEEFIEPFYNSGFPGLTYACYSVIKNG